MLDRYEQKLGFACFVSGEVKWFRRPSFGQMSLEKYDPLLVAIKEPRCHEEQIPVQYRKVHVW
jgi:hypothetical protein